MSQRAKGLPPLTDAHRQAAFEAMAWVGWTYEQALADPLRSRLIECRASLMRKAEHRAWTRYPYNPAATPGRGHDCKRAAAGDLDDDP